ncbi:hypothetical protein D9M72_455940 [compost metagenome]
MLGRMCKSVIATSPRPAQRAACTYSRFHRPIEAPRVTRAKTGMLKMPIAIIALVAPGPKMAVMITAVRSAGKAKARSLMRMTRPSTQPPRAAAQAPSGTPMPAPTKTATIETEIELRAPTMIIDRMSRPKLSVPNQWARLGPCSLSRKFIAVGE